MAVNAFTILVVISLLLAILSLVRPGRPVLAVSVVLLAVAGPAAVSPAGFLKTASRVS
jgi:hypothetical protein